MPVYHLHAYNTSNKSVKAVHRRLDLITLPDNLVNCPHDTYYLEPDPTKRIQAAYDWNEWHDRSHEAIVHILKDAGWLSKAVNAWDIGVEGEESGFCFFGPKGVPLFELIKAEQKAIA